MAHNFGPVSLRTVVLLVVLFVFLAGNLLVAKSVADGLLCTQYTSEMDFTSSTTGLDRPTTSTTNKNVHDRPTHTLVVVRCQGKMDWLKDVPTDWRIIVYEKCERNPFKLSTKYSVTTAVKAEAEECNGYFDYLFDYHDNLTDVTVFFHDDGLIPYIKQERREEAKTDEGFYHTPFHNFSQVVSATERFLTPAQPYLSLGVSTKEELWGTDSYHGDSEKILWPYLRTDSVPRPPTVIKYKPSGHMAVRKEAILSRSKETYGALLQQVRYARDVPQWLNSRMLCCAMERTWHILFGQDPILPVAAMAKELLLKETNQTAVIWPTHHDHYDQ